MHCWPILCVRLATLRDGGCIDFAELARRLRRIVREESDSVPGKRAANRWIFWLSSVRFAPVRVAHPIQRGLCVCHSRGYSTEDEQYHPDCPRFAPKDPVNWAEQKRPNHNTAFTRLPARIPDFECNAICRSIGPRQFWRRIWSRHGSRSGCRNSSGNSALRG